MFQQMLSATPVHRNRIVLLGNEIRCSPVLGGETECVLNFSMIKNDNRMSNVSVLIQVSWPEDGESLKSEI